jgi:hypothetical protein
MIVLFWSTFLWAEEIEDKPSSLLIFSCGYYDGLILQTGLHMGRVSKGFLISGGFKCSVGNANTYRDELPWVTPVGLSYELAEARREYFQLMVGRYWGTGQDRIYIAIEAVFVTIYQKEYFGKEVRGIDKSYPVLKYGEVLHGIRFGYCFKATAAHSGLVEIGLNRDFVGISLGMGFNLRR